MKKLGLTLNFLFLFLGMMIFLGGCTTKLVSEEFDVIFANSVAQGIELNSKLQIIPLSTSVPVIFDVYNYADESIQFIDQTFGLQAFALDEELPQWVKVKIPYSSLFSNEVNLPAHLISYDPNFVNQVVLVEDLFGNIGYEKLRLYVQGQGNVSGKIYGAYVDVLIHP